MRLQVLLMQCLQQEQRRQQLLLQHLQRNRQRMLAVVPAPAEGRTELSMF